MKSLFEKICMCGVFNFCLLIQYVVAKQLILIGKLTFFKKILLEHKKGHKHRTHTRSLFLDHIQFLRNQKSIDPSMRIRSLGRRFRAEELATRRT
jgi:hypothetical protein